MLTNQTRFCQHRDLSGDDPLKPGATTASAICCVSSNFVSAGIRPVLTHKCGTAFLALVAGSRLMERVTRDHQTRFMLTAVHTRCFVGQKVEDRCAGSR